MRSRRFIACRPIAAKVPSTVATIEEIAATERVTASASVISGVENS